LFVYQIKNNKLIVDSNFKSTIVQYRHYKYFTDDKNLIESSNNSSFVFDFEGKENEIAVIINECVMIVFKKLKRYKW